MINDKNIELRKLAALFDGLGHYRRLLVVRALQQAGAKGLSFGALAEATGIGESGHGFSQHRYREMNNDRNTR